MWKYTVPKSITIIIIHETLLCLKFKSSLRLRTPSNINKYDYYTV